MIKTNAFLSSGNSTVFSFLCIELFSSLVALSRGYNPRILKTLFMIMHAFMFHDVLTLHAILNFVK